MTYSVVKATSEALRKKAFAIREEVFVIEQEVSAREEFDAYEDESHHFVALGVNDEPVGSARWRKAEKGIKLERFTAKQNMRRQGLGSALVQAVLDDIAENHASGTYLYLHAQIQAVPLYSKFGFQTEGDPFDECGIMHYLMWRTL